MSKDIEVFIRTGERHLGSDDSWVWSDCQTSKLLVTWGVDKDAAVSETLLQVKKILGQLLDVGRK